MILNFYFYLQNCVFFLQILTPNLYIYIKTVESGAAQVEEAGAKAPSLIPSLPQKTFEPP